MIFPIVLQPKLIAVRARWRENLRRRTQLGRDIFLIAFSIAVMFSIFQGTLTMIEKINANTHLAYMPPSLPLGLILLFLLAMLFFSNCISALGAFFLGKDLDLILASPLSPTRFFWGKLTEIALSSSWMALIFGAPAILAFAVWYQASAFFWLTLLVSLLPYFLIPSALSIILVTAFTVFVPANRTREVLLVIFALVLLAIYMVGKLLTPENASFNNVNDLLRMVSILSLPNTTWVPSYWCATVLSEVLSPSGKNWWPYLGLQYSVMTALISAAYVLFRTCHFAAFSRAKDNRQTLRLSSKTSQFIWVAITPFIPPPYRAIIAKEFKVFARDMTQAVQLLLLLGLTIIYLYNFRVLHAVGDLPENSRVWWQGFLVASNLAMGAFVITAVCTRFVFPSVSLEGQSFWILQTAPLSIRDILRAKFWCWFIPVSSISSVIFASGALAINAEPHVVLINALSSWIVCYGIVGIATGLGALFANFEWEHPSQLAASFGSLIFMLCATLHIGLNLIPSGTLIFLRTLRLSGYEFSDLQWYSAVFCAAALLSYLNYAATRWALTIGENALKQRMQR
ncbi:MAG: hypothetical protein K1X79_08895 [Oligoflexia bacterium]|nr:hypothetical protein [Oligoflexia bacterium]